VPHGPAATDVKRAPIQGQWFGWSSSLNGFCDLAASLDCDGPVILARFGLDRSAEEPPGYPILTIALFGALAELAAQSGKPDIGLRLVRSNRFRFWVRSAR